MFKLTGTIKMIGPTTPVTEKFTKREFVILDEASMYPQTILFQAAQDKCGMLDAFMEGETVEVSFNLRGREWNSPDGETKYFNTLDAWRVEKVTYQNQQNNDAPPPPMQKNAEKSVEKGPGAIATQDAGNEEDDDDLPF